MISGGIENRKVWKFPEFGGMKSAECRIILIRAEKSYFGKTDFSLECLCSSCPVRPIVNFSSNAIHFTLCSVTELVVETRYSRPLSFLSKTAVWQIVLFFRAECTVSRLYRAVFEWPSKTKAKAIRSNLVSRDAIPASRDEKIMSFPHELCLKRHQLLNQMVSTGFIATQGRRRLSLVDTVSSTSPSSQRMRGLWVKYGLKGIKEETDLRGNSWIFWLAVVKSSRSSRRKLPVDSCRDQVDLVYRQRVWIYRPHTENVGTNQQLKTGETIWIDRDAIHIQKSEVKKVKRSLIFMTFCCS